MKGLGFAMHSADDRPDPVMLEIYERMTAAQRLAVVDRLTRGARDMAMTGIRRDHPTWSDLEVRREAGRRMLSRGDF